MRTEEKLVKKKGMNICGSNNKIGVGYLHSNIEIANLRTYTELPSFLKVGYTTDKTRRRSFITTGAPI